MKEQFEKEFPIPAHWIEWSETKGRYDCHVGLADNKCSEYNNMFKVWKSQQIKINETEDKLIELLRSWSAKKVDAFNKGETNKAFYYGKCFDELSYVLDRF